jgi:hypothetical protein
LNQRDPAAHYRRSVFIYDYATHHRGINLKIGRQVPTSGSCPELEFVGLHFACVDYRFSESDI